MCLIINLERRRRRARFCRRTETVRTICDDVDAWRSECVADWSVVGWSRDDVETAKPRRSSYVGCIFSSSAFIIPKFWADMNNLQWYSGVQDRAKPWCATLRATRVPLDSVPLWTLSTEYLSTALRCSTIVRSRWIEDQILSDGRASLSLQLANGSGRGGRSVYLYTAASLALLCHFIHFIWSQRHMLYLDLAFPVHSDFLSPRVTDQDSFLACRCWFHADTASANRFAYRRFNAEVQAN